MRITVGQLRQIIKEEVSRVNKRRRLYEFGEAPPPPPPAHQQKQQSQVNYTELFSIPGFVTGITDIANNSEQRHPEQVSKARTELQAMGISGDVEVKKVAELLYKLAAGTNLSVDEVKTLSNFGIEARDPILRIGAGRANPSSAPVRRGR